MPNTATQSNVKNIMIVGVGGQGTLLASKLMGKAFVEKGFDVKVSEVHGMSQRGGSVVTYVRYGEKVYSPIVSEGTADVILAFEQLEALRWVSFLSPEGTLIYNTQQINPMPVITGAAQYPEEIDAKLREVSPKILSVDAAKLALEAGNIKSVNVVLIGVLAATLTIPKEDWVEALKKTVPPKFLELNLKAFELGYSLK